MWYAMIPGVSGRVYTYELTDLPKDTSEVELGIMAGVAHGRAREAGQVHESLALPVTYEWRPPGLNPFVTEEQAGACLKIVAAWIADKAGPDREPKLHEPGFHSRGWTIALGGLEIEWPYLMWSDMSITWPEGVWVEPGSHWYLCLHTKESAQQAAEREAAYKRANGLIP